MTSSRDSEILRRRADALSQPLDALEQSGEVIQEWLIFSRGDGLFGIPVHSVSEVRPAPTCTLVPYSIGVLLGVFNVRGLIYSLVDPVKLLRDEGDSGNPATKVVLLESGELRVAFAADSILGLSSISRNQIRPSPLPLAPDRSQLVLGVTTERWVLLDVPSVLGDMRILEFSTHPGAP